MNIESVALIVALTIAMASIIYSAYDLLHTE